MIETTLQIGGRNYRVAYEEGQDAEFNYAAKIFQDEARGLQAQAASISETQLLMMSGLMLAYRIKETEGDQTSKSARLREIERELDVVKADARKAAAPNTELQAAFDRMKNENLSLLADTKNLTAERNGAAKRIYELEAAIEALQDKNKKLASELETARSQDDGTEQLQSELAKVKQKNKELASRFEATQKALQGEIAHLKNFSSNTDELEALKDANSKLKAKYDAIQTELEELQTRTETVDQSEEVNKLQSRVNELSQENKTIAAELEKVKSESKEPTNNAPNDLAAMMGELVSGLEGLAKK